VKRASFSTSKHPFAMRRVFIVTSRDRITVRRNFMLSLSFFLSE
jgi:hypothetical protein